MQYPKQPLIIAAILSMASHSLACVDFGFTISQFDYGAGDLSDNGVKICTFNGYGGNKGYNMKCNPGYSAATTPAPVGQHRVGISRSASPRRSVRLATLSLARNLCRAVLQGHSHRGIWVFRDARRELGCCCLFLYLS
ncbi:unnamed protein product [Zymoseptoria tritici ST99CH_1E4]|uniref:Cyanovirin-N domain-containing protein n=1 Tax=Zymoseptoria tritici ST99CH_1E4 TaxID=1276532 RepID=A0A2H1FM10_ZYMTR|nr:unnamed protein product [Zymoseptoria tritici ST99CH_1E4]